MDSELEGVQESTSKHEPNTNDDNEDPGEGPQWSEPL